MIQQRTYNLHIILKYFDIRIFYCEYNSFPGGPVALFYHTSASDHITLSYDLNLLYSREKVTTFDVNKAIC